MEKEEEESMELVRFQFDGELTLEITISGDELNCTNFNLKDDYNGADSLHVLKYMEGFAVTVKPKYTLIKELNLYCDIMGDDLKLRIINQVGIDSNEGFDEFLSEMRAKNKAAADLLEKCRDTGCEFDINHDKDENDKKSGGAIVRKKFSAGRPNIVSPYTKNMIFSIQGGTASVTHTAAIVDGGYYSKGPGNSFALPTHKPIMILRDPPGGLSYATYENVKTTIELETSSTSTDIHHHFGLELSSTIEMKLEMCLGLGAASCEELFRFDQDFKVFGYNHDLGGVVQKSDKKRSTQYTTTWSYQTSSDPWTAGAMSDVFIVPNLNVMYRNVQVVYWENEGSCAVKEVNGTLPETSTINLEDEENQPALAFFSRYHVEYVKLPELKDQADNIKKVKSDCDCDNKKDEFMCKYGKNEEKSCDVLDKQVTYLKNAIGEWEEFLLPPKNNFTESSI